MKRIVQLLVLVAVLAVVPALLPPYYVTLLNYIGISALVAVGLVPVILLSRTLRSRG